MISLCKVKKIYVSKVRNILVSFVKFYLKNTVFLRLCGIDSETE